MSVFPQANLNPQVEIYTGSWTDISTEVYQRAPIAITRGRPDESSQVSPSQCTLTLNNRDNRFSVNNPVGPYFGLLGRNTPIRASVPNSLLPTPGNTTYLRMEDDAVSLASCPAATRIELTGSLDVRVDVHPSGYGAFTLASIWGASASVNQRSWEFGLTISGQLFFAYTTDGTLATAHFANSDGRVPIGVGRISLRATLDATTGNVAFYTGPAGGADVGPWTQLGPTISGSGAVAPFASTTTPLTVGYSAGNAFDFATNIALQGAVFDMELRSGIGGTVVAHPAFNAQTAGATSWTDAPGNSWSVSGTAVLSNRSYRYHGELAQLPKAADPSGNDVYSQATASGVLRRLQQAQNPINSPMYRAYTRATGTSTPAAYWPCEDTVGATQLASGLPGGTGMQISGTPQLAGDSTIVSSAPVPTLNGSIWRAQVPQGATQTSNIMQLVAAFPSSPTSEANEEIIASVYTLGTVVRCDLMYDTVPAGGGLTIAGYNAAGTQLFFVGPFSPGSGELVNGNNMLITFGLTNVAGTVNWNIAVYGPSAATITSNSGAVAGATFGVTTSVAVNTGGQCQQVAVGHVAVQLSGATTGALVKPFNAWGGETAGTRVQRLCTEEGVAVRIVGHPELSVQMGPQTLETLPDLLQECETTDRGMLFEPRTCLGIGYRTLNSMYNQAPKATAVYSQGMVDQGFAATVDDLITLNDVTVTNVDGSSARQYLASGTMSIQPPPGGVGKVDTSIEVNALSDGYLAHIAQWILHASTDPHDRFPVVPFNLARSETPFSVATLDVGDLAAVTNPPPWLQPDEIDQLCAGFTETLGPYAVWQINANGIPAYPYTVAITAPSTSGAAAFTGAGYAMHVDTDGTTLTSAVSSSATGLSFTSMPFYPPWTSNPADYPFDVNIAGERVTILGPGTCLGTDPLLAQGTANYSAGDATIAMSGAVGAPYPATGYGQQAILVTPVGSPDTFAQVLGKVAAAATSTTYTVWAWVYATAARTYTLFANWLLSGTQVSFGDATPVAVPAGAWTLISGTITSPASGINQLIFGVNDTSSPTTAQTYYVWGLNGAKTSTITAASPQLMTGQRSVNGVAKAQASGTSLTLWYRPVVGQLTGA